MMRRRRPVRSISLVCRCQETTAAVETFLLRCPKRRSLGVSHPIDRSLERERTTIFSS